MCIGAVDIKALVPSHWRVSHLVFPFLPSRELDTNTYLIQGHTTLQELRTRNGTALQLVSWPALITYSVAAASSRQVPPN